MKNLTSLVRRAQQLAGNAVMNIVSYYNKNEIASTIEFECHLGNVIAVVALKGDISKLPTNRILASG